uniref:PNPLA domain-containing protein n=1 Tax=Macrostomum lignano TaxID=282301 RepID=A0A1I8JLJ7_9PLAT
WRRPAAVAGPVPLPHRAAADRARLASTAQWPEVLACLQCLHRQPQLNVPAGLAATGTRVAVADAALEAFLHCDMLDLANALVATSGGPRPVRPGPARPLPGSLSRTCARRRGGDGMAANTVNAFIAAAQLADFCDGERPGRIEMSNWRIFRRTSYAAAYSCCLRDLATTARSCRPDLKHAYRLFNASTSFPNLPAEGPATALRLMLCSAVRLSLPDLALPLAKIGTRPDCFSLSLPGDLAGEESAALLALCHRCLRDRRAGAAPGRTLLARRCLRLVPLPPDGPRPGICPAGRPVARRRRRPDSPRRGRHRLPCWQCCSGRGDIFNSTLMVGPVGLLGPPVPLQLATGRPGHQPVSGAGGSLQKNGSFPSFYSSYSTADQFRIWAEIIEFFKGQRWGSVVTH